MHFLWRCISGVFRWTWRILNFIREFILNVFLILLILVCVGIYFQMQTKPVEPVKGALLVNLTGVVVDNPAISNKFSQIGRELLGASSNRLQENSLFDVVDMIRQAKTDPNITGMVLSLNDFAGADQPSLQYMGKALREFRDSGKPIFATSDSYSQAQYYLASYANKIYLSPQGVVDLHGMATNNLYYKTLLDKLKVSTHIFRVGTYKSAVEPMIRDDMSPAARDADNEWLSGMWNNYVATVAANRQITAEQLFPGAEGVLKGLQAAGGDTAKYALDNKLVDGLASRSDVENLFTKAFGWNKTTKDFSAISMYDYTPPAEKKSGSEIAVIFADGAIMDGEATPGNVGGDTTASQIRDARLNPKIKAIVLRVNSPGGSVSASEVIRSELAAARAAGKPVVVSMGGLAASGGYWISTPANYIVASPSTLTGSIGIFGVINTFENTLDSIGVHTDGVATSPLADLTVTKALPEAFSQMMQINIENGYKNFITLVAKARNKTPDQVDAIAQGRVWLGTDAKKNGLVDQLGDFDDAVTKAAELAKLKTYQLNWFVEDPSFGQMVLGQLTGSVQAALPSAVRAMLPESLVRISALLKDKTDWMATLNDPQNRYALCMSCGDVK
ncbi:signal peptide peptidase SppA [Obesumbacterium proteus]|uniref:signal peptide peptidase SppA n=1 Tax=Obesumbacterium proteus TaxID=82983 RepID=UPI0010354960|nr:signal peptide peptidase SppA [Obesumbacterium proteus]TBL72114.1 signal peptide peptidase SppA [Obesumbacterium proteus]